jgi:hypothetical protein
MKLLNTSVINPPTIDIQHLCKTSDREEFRIRVRQASNDYTFGLSITSALLVTWRVDPDEAAMFLVDRLVYSHGTAKEFKEEGYWFDSYNSPASFEQTIHDIENKGASFFDHPSIRTTLGSRLFGVLDALDQTRTAIDAEPFIRSVDVLFERSQGGDDFESEAPDHAHFIYRVCMLSAIIDLLNFVHKEGSLNGLRVWLEGRLDTEQASKLTQPFYMLKKLRRQYPIHEEYRLDAEGSRTRRSDLEEGERYFGVTQQPSHDWPAVRTKFVVALEDLRAALEPAG